MIAKFILKIGSGAKVILRAEPNEKNKMKKDEEKDEKKTRKRPKSRFLLFGLFKFYINI